MIKKKHSQLIIYASVYLVFLLLGTLAGLHHEPWADEAQSWLIARDNHSIIDIIKAVRYEGTLPTWSLIIKLFQICGLDYDHIFVISLFFSAIGVILLFMSDSPKIIKILLPFSFYTVFQNTVVARQYSLVFPAMMLILLFYKERLSSPIKHYLSLIIMGLTSSYGIIISCSFMLWDFICMFKNNTKSLYDKRHKSFFFISGAIIFGLGLASYPPSDVAFVTTRISFIDSFTTTFLFHIENTVLQYATLATILMLLCYHFRKCLFQFATIFSPITIYMAFFYHRLWHTCYLFYLVIILIILLGEKNEGEKENKKLPISLLNITFCCLLAIQCIAGLYSVYYDYFYQYSATKSAAEFITPYVNSGTSIDMCGYNAIGVQPYFNSNIYANYNSDKSYYIWSADKTKIELSTPPSDLIVASGSITNDEYKTYTFTGGMIFKFDMAESSNIIVLIKKTP